jgi:hypothetical protein
MNKGKGKVRANGNDDSYNRLSGGQPSMLSRVAASATGLTRSAFATPNANELNKLAVAPLAEKGQAGRSFSDTDNLARAESSRGSQKPHPGSLSGAFKFSHSEEHVQQSEKQFSSFLDGIDSFTPSADIGRDHFASGGLGDSLVAAWTRSQPAPGLASPRPFFGSVAEQEVRDGEDVLALLSLSGALDEKFELTPEEEDHDWGLTAEQISQLQAITKHLFPPVDMHGAIDPNNPLNLAPSFSDVNGQPLLESESWREQWDGVLNRYADEVWGNLLPLVREARQEVEDLRQDASSSEEPKAVRRLGAILGHLRSH